MPPHNFSIIQQSGNEVQNGSSSPVKPQTQSPSRNAFSASDMLDIDEIMSSFSTPSNNNNNNISQNNENRNYQQVVSLCLSGEIDSQERLQMFNVLARNINLSELNSSGNTSDSSSINSDRSGTRLGSDGAEERTSTDDTILPNSSSSSNSSSSCNSPSTSTKRNVSKSVKDRQRRRPRRYKYNPKPLIEKVSRQAVPREQKDNEYWERRQLNNLAARKTREERRAKELEVLNTINRLENDNSNLKDCLTKLEEKNKFLIAEFTRRTGEPHVH